MFIQANRFRISQIFLNPLAVGFNCFSKSAWKQLTVVLKLHLDFSPFKGFRNATARGFRKNCETSEAFGKGKIKFIK